MASEDSEPCYLDRNALALLRDWPVGVAWDQPTYERLFWAHVIATPWKQIHPDRAPVLGQLGVALKDIIDKQPSLNFFSVEQILGLWPIELLAMRRDDCTEYLKLFGLDWNESQVRRYIARGLEKPEIPTMGEPVDPQPARAALKLTISTEGAGLLPAIARLVRALGELESEVISYGK